MAASSSQFALFLDKLLDNSIPEKTTEIGPLFLVVLFLVYVVVVDAAAEVHCSWLCCSCLFYLDLYCTFYRSKVYVNLMSLSFHTCLRFLTPSDQGSSCVLVVILHNH